MRKPALTAAVVALGLLAGCTQPTPPSPPSPSASVVALDLTQPGQARSMVRKLIAKAGTSNLIQVELTKTYAAITVIKDSEPQTWAWRDNTIKEVDSDVVYVQQRIFSIEDFNIADLGGLFRAAAGTSGSESGQELQIVDSSAGEVFMSVSTNPESRTVFFRSDGSLLPTLDFATRGGIRDGLAEVIGSRSSAMAIGIQSGLGAWLDYPGTGSTTIRRMRSSAVPVTINERAQNPDLPVFSVSGVDPNAIWTVLDAARQRGEFTAETRWQVVIDDRARTGTPRMYFSIGAESIQTTLNGEIITP